MASSVTLEGGLSRLKSAALAGVQAETEAIARDIQREAVRLAPSRTGDLRACLADPEAVHLDGNNRWTFGLTPALRARCPYAMYVEFGTKAKASRAAREAIAFLRRGRRAYRGHAATPAQPFLRPALAIVQSQIAKSAGRSLDRALRAAYEGRGGDILGGYSRISDESNAQARQALYAGRRVKKD